MSLQSFLVSWWRPPRFEDLEDQRVAALTLPLATIFAVCVALWIPVAFWVYHLTLWPVLPAKQSPGARPIEKSLQEVPLIPVNDVHRIPVHELGESHRHSDKHRRNNPRSRASEHRPA